MQERVTVTLATSSAPTSRLTLRRWQPEKPLSGDPNTTSTVLSVPLSSAAISQSATWKIPNNVVDMGGRVSVDSDAASHILLVGVFRPAVSSVSIIPSYTSKISLPGKFPGARFKIRKAVRSGVNTHPAKKPRSALANKTSSLRAASFFLGTRSVIDRESGANSKFCGFARLNAFEA